LGPRKGSEGIWGAEGLGLGLVAWTDVVGVEAHYKLNRMGKPGIHGRSY
jgi:hypothetical protein